MEKERSSKIIAVVALVVAVIGVSVGFAAFSATLTINNATVGGTKADNDTNFKNKLTITGVSCDGDEGTYNAGSVSDDEFSWSGASVNLSKPNDTMTCTATVKNDSAYIAYLNSIELDSNITCGKVSEDGQSITAACNGLQLKVNGNVNAEATATTASHTNATDVDGDSIGIGQIGEISFTVTYTHTTVLDADYTAKLPTMTFNYSTVD